MVRASAHPRPRALVSRSDALVACTHECDLCPDAAGMAAAERRGVCRVTRAGIDAERETQAEIHRTVVAAAAGGTASEEDNASQPLYALDGALLVHCAPTVVLTQDLCGVCAVDSEDVGRALLGCGGDGPRVVSLSPATLAQVGESFEVIAEACGVTERGAAMRRKFEAELRAVGTAVEAAIAASASVGSGISSRPRVALLEWLEPPFDGGHWVPEMLALASGADPALQAKAGAKSRVRSWEEVAAADPDVVLVACCGFDTRRNVADALRAARQGPLARLRAWREGRVYALDGNRYFACPGPSLAAGAALAARCAWDGHAAALAAFASAELPFLPLEGEAWVRLGADVDPTALAEEGAVAPVGDIENWHALHERACAVGELTYVDPETGYSVMTRIKHKQRGRCCGSGCRHCPFSHSATKDKARRIQQPAWLRPLGSAGADAGVTVLFWSGGKDSFLALRALLRQGRAPGEVALLTTFDAVSRRIAHQDVAIADVLKQAEHLDLALLGVPLHRGGDYSETIKVALELAQQAARGVRAIACGDLHLWHIRTWREEQLGRFGIPFEFPIWSDEAGSNYAALARDLEASGVPCAISAVADERAARGGCAVGDVYGVNVRQRLLEAGLDAFGEDGEVHTLARVWEVPAARALGQSQE